MAFPDSTWPCGYDVWNVESSSSEKVTTILWNIGSFLRECQEERKELRSYDFGFAGATWNLFTAFDRQKVQSLFGINVKPHSVSNAVFDCHSEMEFLDEDSNAIKKIDLKFNCENADSHSAVTDFLTNSELDMFLRQGCLIKCRITVKISNIKKACPEISRSSNSNTDAAHTLNQMLPNYLISFSDSSWFWTGCDEWWLFSHSPKAVEVNWNIGSFLRECREEIKGLRSYDFGFADATWNLFTTLDGKEAHSLFGIKVKPLRLSNAVFDCYCEITFRGTNRTIKKIECRFKCGSAESYWALQNFLSNSELDTFLQQGSTIQCTITVKKSSIKEVCPEIAHSSSSSVVEARTQLQSLESKDEEIPKTKSVYKLCHDLKQLMLSEEYSDVTLQVQHRQFKAHRSILAARSSVFAAIFRHDMKEKNTGVVDVEDGESSSFPVFLEFIYTGCTEKISVENVFNLYTSADKYDVQELKLECLDFMKNNLSVETFCETVRLSLIHSETSLLKLTIDFFARNMKKIILTAKWQSFVSENPIQGNEILIKALGADSQAD